MLQLSYPVSANRYWRTYRNVVTRSEEAMAYRWEAMVAAKKAGIGVMDGPVCVELFLLPKQTKTGAESKRRIDLDNAIKVSIDALNGIAYHDDKQVTRIVAEIGEPVHGGGLRIRVTERDACSATI